jgi:hypothetical protein
MTQNIQPKPLGFVMADGIADALFGRRKGAASCPACAGVGFHFFDCALSPLTPEKPQASNFTPLVNLVGAREAGDFMLMGNDGDLMLYKHINSRRYLNINRISGRTFKFVACDREYTAIPHDEALAYVRG